MGGIQNAHDTIQERRKKIVGLNVYTRCSAFDFANYFSTCRIKTFPRNLTNFTADENYYCWKPWRNIGSNDCGLNLFKNASPWTKDVQTKFSLTHVYFSQLILPRQRLFPNYLTKRDEQREYMYWREMDARRCCTGIKFTQLPNYFSLLKIFYHVLIFQDERW